MSYRGFLQACEDDDYDNVLDLFRNIDAKVWEHELFFEGITTAIENGSLQALKNLLPHANRVLPPIYKLKIGKRVAEAIVQDETDQLLNFFANVSITMIDVNQVIKLALSKQHHVVLENVCQLFPYHSSMFDCTAALSHAARNEHLHFLMFLLKNFATWNPKHVLRSAMDSHNVFYLDLLLQQPKIQKCADIKCKAFDDAAYSYPEDFAIRLLQDNDVIQGQKKRISKSECLFRGTRTLLETLGLKQKVPHHWSALGRRDIVTRKFSILRLSSFSLALGLAKLCLPVLLQVEIAQLLCEPFSNCIELHYFWTFIASCNL